MIGRPGRLKLWAGAATLALAAPLAGHAVIESAIDGALVPALERATGESVELDGVEVSLFGSIALTGLDLGGFIAAGRVEGRIALGSLLAARLSADEIEIERPRIELRQGGRRLRQLVARLHARRERAVDSRPGQAARWPHLRVSGGELRIRSDASQMVIRGLRARPIGAGLRLVSDAVEVSGELGGRPVAIDFVRAAADVDTAGGRLERAVALGGSGRWGAIAIDGISAVRDRRGERIRAEVSGGAIALRRRGDAVAGSLTAVPASALSPLFGSLELSRGTLNGSLRGRGRRAHLELRVDGVTGQLSWLASEPVDLSSHIEADLALIGGDNLRLDVERLAVTRGALVATLSGVISGPGSGQLSLAIDELPCAELLESLPPQLTSALRGMQLDGRLAGRFDLRFDLGRPVPEALSLAVDLDPDRCVVRGEAPRFVAGLEASTQVSLAALPAHVPAAFLAAEDNRFYEHRGFDRRQIELSLAENLKARELLRGGSTITQQLAKNLFLHTRRTLARKLQEAVLAWRLEATHDKREILARYLGIIQLGREVRGLEPAARHWFAKSAARLTPREAAFLACLTRAPTTLERQIRADGGLDPALARRIDNLLASLRFSGAISMATYRQAMSQELVLAPLAVATR